MRLRVGVDCGCLRVAVRGCARSHVCVYERGYARDLLCLCCSKVVSGWKWRARRISHRDVPYFHSCLSLPSLFLFENLRATPHRLPATTSTNKTRTLTSACTPWGTPVSLLPRSATHAGEADRQVTATQGSHRPMNAAACSVRSLFLLLPRRGAYPLLACGGGCGEGEGRRAAAAPRRLCTSALPAPSLVPPPTSHPLPPLPSPLPLAISQEYHLPSSVVPQYLSFPLSHPSPRVPLIHKHQHTHTHTRRRLR